jgi:hypothetical protein
LDENLSRPITTFDEVPPSSMPAHSTAACAAAGGRHEKVLT